MAAKRKSLAECISIPEVEGFLEQNKREKRVLEKENEILHKYVEKMLIAIGGKWAAKVRGGPESNLNTASQFIESQLVR